MPAVAVVIVTTPQVTAKGLSDLSDLSNLSEASDDRKSNARRQTQTPANAATTNTPHDSAGGHSEGCCICQASPNHQPRAAAT
jgi:hypothetical protein